jgi:integral membrane protein
MMSLVYKFEHNTLFNEEEGWVLFSVAAIAEAVGWTLLITGIGLSRYVFPHSQVPVKIAGQIHGTLFGLYALAAIGLYPTLRWSRLKALAALAASVLPYGSLAFELWAGRLRKNEKYRIQRNCVALTVLTYNP